MNTFRSQIASPWLAGYQVPCPYPDPFQEAYPFQSWNALQGAETDNFMRPSENSEMKKEAIKSEPIKKQEPQIEAFLPNIANRVKVSDDPSPQIYGDLNQPEDEGPLNVEEEKNICKHQQNAVQNPSSPLKQEKYPNIKEQEYQEEQQESDTEKYELKPSPAKRGWPVRKLPNEITIKKFQKILNSPLPTLPFDIVTKVYEEQLEADLQKQAKESGDDVEGYIVREMDLARKNITQKYLRLYRLVFQLINQAQYEEESVEKLRTVLSHSVCSIPTIMKIYRDPDFEFFVDFLKQEVVTEERFPEFIMALPMRPAEKLVMLGGIMGMICAINNPQVTLRSWYFDPKDILGDTTHIVKAIKEKRIDAEEVVHMLLEVYEEVKKVQPPPINPSRYSNIASRFATIIQQAFGEACKRGVLSKKDEEDLKHITKRTSKSASIATIKQLLSFATLRDYLKANFIDNNRLMIQVLSDPSLNCRTKLGILESYSCFVRAVDDPRSLKKWQ